MSKLTCEYTWVNRSVFLLKGENSFPPVCMLGIPMVHQMRVL